MPTIEHILADAEIRSLISRERYYRDTAAWSKLRNCYHPDNSKTFIELSWFKGTIDELIDISKQQFSQGKDPGLIHSLTPGEITIRGDNALSISTVQIVVRHVHEGTEFDMSSWIRLVSRLERVEEAGDLAWKLLSLEAIYLRDSIALSDAFGKAKLPAMDLGMLSHARQSYKYISWHASLLGVDVRKDLPGSDDPGSVEQLLERSYAWLEGRQK